MLTKGKQLNANSSKLTSNPNMMQTAQFFNQLSQLTEGSHCEKFQEDQVDQNLVDLNEFIELKPKIQVFFIFIILKLKFFFSFSTQNLSQFLNTNVNQVEEYKQEPLSTNVTTSNNQKKKNPTGRKQIRNTNKAGQSQPELKEKKRIKSSTEQLSMLVPIQSNSEAVPLSQQIALNTTKPTFANDLKIQNEKSEVVRRAQRVDQESIVNEVKKRGISLVCESENNQATDQVFWNKINKIMCSNNNGGSINQPVYSPFNYCSLQNSHQKSMSNAGSQKLLSVPQNSQAGSSTSTNNNKNINIATNSKSSHDKTESICLQNFNQKFMNKPLHSSQQIDIHLNQLQQQSFQSPYHSMKHFNLQSEFLPLLKNGNGFIGTNIQSLPDVVQRSSELFKKGVPNGNSDVSKWAPQININERNFWSSQTSVRQDQQNLHSVHFTTSLHPNQMLSMHQNRQSMVNRRENSHVALSTSPPQRILQSQAYQIAQIHPNYQSCRNILQQQNKQQGLNEMQQHVAQSSCSNALFFPHEKITKTPNNFMNELPSSSSQQREIPQPLFFSKAQIEGFDNYYFDSQNQLLKPSTNIFSSSSTDTSTIKETTAQVQQTKQNVQSAVNEKENKLKKSKLELRNCNESNQQTNDQYKMLTLPQSAFAETKQKQSTKTHQSKPKSNLNTNACTQKEINKQAADQESMKENLQHPFKTVTLENESKPYLEKKVKKENSLVNCRSYRANGNLSEHNNRNEILHLQNPQKNSVVLSELRNINQQGEVNKQNQRSDKQLVNSESRFQNQGNHLKQQLPSQSFEQQNLLPIQKGRIKSCQQQVQQTNQQEFSFCYYRNLTAARNDDNQINLDDRNILASIENLNENINQQNTQKEFMSTNEKNNTNVKKWNQFGSLSQTTKNNSKFNLKCKQQQNVVRKIFNFDTYQGSQTASASTTNASNVDPFTDTQNTKVRRQSINSQGSNFLFNKVSSSNNPHQTSQHILFNQQQLQLQKQLMYYAEHKQL